MKKYLVVSDVHNDEDIVNFMIDLYKPDAVLDCGDHEKDFFKDKKLPWYFISGNHEDEDAINFLKNGGKIKNLHYIQSGNLINLDGIYLTGFGGNYSQKTFQGDRKKKSRLQHITKDDYDAIKYMRNKDLVSILLMHESTKELWKKTPNQNLGQEIHSKVVEMFPNLKYVFSGHYHIPMQKNINGVEQISLNSVNNYNHILLKNHNNKLVIENIENNESAKNKYIE